MAKKNILLKSKDRRTVQEVATFLRQLADRMEQHEIALQRGGEDIHIELPDRVTFKVKAKEKAKKRTTKHQLKLTLKWKDSDRRRDFVQVA